MAAGIGGWRGEGTAGAIATSGPCYATLKSSASSPYGRATAIKANSYVSLMHTHTHTHTQCEVAAGGVKNLPVQRNLIREQLKVTQTDRQTDRQAGVFPPV